MIHHHSDVHLFTAIKYARSFIKESAYAQYTLRNQVLDFSKEMSVENGAPHFNEMEQFVISFRGYPTNFDRPVEVHGEICRLLQLRSAEKRTTGIILIGARPVHFHFLRELSRTFNLLLVLVDQPIDDELQMISFHSDLKGNSSRITEPFFHQKSPFEIQMSPPYHDVLFHILKKKEWTNFHYVYDSEQSLSRANSLLQQLSQQGIIVEMVMRYVEIHESHHSDSKEASLLFEDLSRTTANDRAQVVLDFDNESNLLKLLKELKERDFFTTNHQYIIAGLNFDSLYSEHIDSNDASKGLKKIKLLNTQAHVDGFHLLSRPGMVTLLPGENFQQMTLHMAKVAKILRDWANLDDVGAGSHRLTAAQALSFDFAMLLNEALSTNSKSHLSFSQQENYENRQGICPNENVPIMREKALKNFHRIISMARLDDHQALTGAVRLSRAERDRGVRIFTGEDGSNKVFHFGQENARSGFRQLGFWNGTGSMHIISPSADYLAKLNASKHYHKHVKIITTIPVEPFLFIEHERNGSNDSFTFRGFIPDLAAAVADLANFEFEFRLVADNNYGVRNATGYWNGMVGEVLDGVSFALAFKSIKLIKIHL